MISIMSGADPEARMSKRDQRMSLFSSILLMTGSAGMVLKHVRVLSVPWICEVSALVFLVVLFCWCKRRGTLHSVFIANVLVLFLVSEAFILEYIL